MRLNSIPAGIAVRAMDSGKLVAVLAAADCVSCLVHGHACTSAGVTARRFAARLAETDAAAAERVAKFLPSLVQASAAEAASDHDTDIDSTPFAEATVAVASLTHPVSHTHLTLPPLHSRQVSLAGVSLVCN